MSCQPLTLARLRPSRSTPAVGTILFAADAADITLSQPATGRPWTSFNLTLCTPATATAAAACEPAVPCAAAANPAAATTCSVGGLAPKTAYSLSAIAIKGAVSSPAVTYNFTAPEYE